MKKYINYILNLLNTLLINISLSVLYTIVYNICDLAECQLGTFFLIKLLLHNPKILFSLTK